MDTPKGINRVLNFPYNALQIQPTTKLIDAMNIFHDRGVSALPVVDEENKCVDVYSRFDVMVSLKAAFHFDRYVFRSKRPTVFSSIHE